jgi:hypothetical protein
MARPCGETAFRSSFFVDLCLKAHCAPSTRTRHNHREQDFIMTTEQGVHQAWTGQSNLPKALQYF